MVLLSSSSSSSDSGSSTWIWLIIYLLYFNFWNSTTSSPYVTSKITINMLQYSTLLIVERETKDKIRSKFQYPQHYYNLYNKPWIFSPIEFNSKNNLEAFNKLCTTFPLLLSLHHNSPSYLRTSTKYNTLHVLQ